MNDLYKNQRQMNYWWRANKDHVLFIVAIAVAVIGFIVLPAIGIYIIT